MLRRRLDSSLAPTDLSMKACSQALRDDLLFQHSLKLKGAEMDRLGVSEDDQRAFWEREEDECSPRSPEALAQTARPDDHLRRGRFQTSACGLTAQPSHFRARPGAAGDLHRPPGRSPTTETKVLTSKSRRSCQNSLAGLFGKESNLKRGRAERERPEEKEEDNSGRKASEVICIQQEERRRRGGGGPRVWEGTRGAGLSRRGPRGRRGPPGARPDTEH